MTRRPRPGDCIDRKESNVGRLEDNVALITGGGTGIGRATALMLAAEGAHIAVNYSRSATEADHTATEIQKMGRRAMAVCADVSDGMAVQAMVEAVMHTFDRLDILVNNAGTTKKVPLGDLEAMTEPDWDRIMAVNAKGTFLCSRAAIAAMRIHGGGQIVNVASNSAFSGHSSCIAYSASKAAVINITRTLALSQGPDIRVNAVAPGFVATRWTEGMQSLMAAEKADTALKKLARPEDVATAIFGLLINDHVTGHTLVVDGGSTL
jgi:3-oxoacyl-[acyl-carrier protein] reductase